MLCAQDAGSISGVITDSLTGAGIAGANVHAGCLGKGDPRSCGGDPAVTDHTGAFRLSGLPDGRYFLYVEKDGYSSSLNGTLNAMATVSASGDTRFDLKLTPLSTLKGRVVDPEGKPVPGIAVQFGIATTITDDQGAFAFEKLNPVTTQLFAKVKAQPDRKDGERLVTTYYPSAIYAEQAVPVQVQGLESSGYEIRLRTAPARTVRGVLLDADGQPIAHASVMLSKPATPEPVPMIRGFSSPSLVWVIPTAGDQSQTGADGAFEFPAVLEGDWILKGYDSWSRQGGAAEVQVRQKDVNVTLRLAKSFPIEVSPDLGVPSESRDSQPSEPEPAPAWVVPLDGQITGSTGRDAGPPFTQHDQGLPGRYLFGPGEATPGYYVSAAMLDGRDVLWQPVELSGPTAVTLVFKKDGGTLRGVVEKGGGSTVVLMAEPTAYARFGLTARCDPDGNFSISDVPPGSYNAVAFQDNKVLYRRDLLSRIDSASSKRVKIDAGVTESVALKVN
jgi:hypothetical protein